MPFSATVKRCALSRNAAKRSRFLSPRWTRERAVVADLIRGDRHSRRTIADSTGKSLPTADRWIEQIGDALPNTRRIREGKTTWLVHDGRKVPSQSVAAGACVAASLAAIFEGSAQERNLKDARDYILRGRGEQYSDLERKFVFAPRSGESALPEAEGDLDTIVLALLQSNRLRFRYQQRLVEPLAQRPDLV